MAQDLRQLVTSELACSAAAVRIGSQPDFFSHRPTSFHQLFTLRGRRAATVCEDAPMYRKLNNSTQTFKVAHKAGEGDEVPTVLFVCVHNAGRSRMAEAFFNQMAGGKFKAISAGTEPAERPHPEVVQAMKELEIDLPPTPGIKLTPELAERAVKVVGMGCAIEEACPALQVPLEDWELEDPKGKPPEEVAEIRDTIELRVRNLLGKLARESL